MIVQTLLAVLSALAIYLVGRKDRFQKWGYVAGLASMPFWLYSTYTGELWGMFALSLFYTFAWGQGCWNHVFTVRRQHESTGLDSAASTET
jgi:hypothetical protein